MILSVSNYNGTKSWSTQYLKDTAETNSSLQKLNLKLFNSLYMLDEDSIVVNRQDNNGQTQLFYGKINATDDEFQQVTNFTREVSGFHFVPSAGQIYYSMPINDPIKRDDGAIFMLYNDTNVRTAGGFVKQGNTIYHIFVANYSISNGNMTVADGTDIFDQFEASFNLNQYKISENGEWIGFTAPGHRLSITKKDEIYNDLFVFPTNMTQKPFKISETKYGENEVSSFSISPSGKTIVWSTRNIEDTNLIDNIHSYNVETRSKMSYLKDYDLYTEGLDAYSDEDFVFTALNNDTSMIYTCNIETGKMEIQTGNDKYYSVIASIMGGTKLITLVSNIITPPELAIFNTTSWEVEPLTSVNTDFISQFDLHSFSRISFNGWNNETVTGFIHEPVGFNSSKEYPAVLMIHGGPNYAQTNNWEVLAWNPALYTSAGYFVIAVNYHGSIGHGRKFMESVSGKWGEKPFKDIMKGLDYALEQNPQIDSKRVCAAGYSYGGYMTNWLSGKSPKRFACFITHAGIFDLDTLYLTGAFAKEGNDRDFVGLDANVSGISDLSKYSPSKFVANWKVPTLVSHGGQDFTVPTDQGLAAFTALQYENISSKFLYFPNEGHGVSNPANVVVQTNAYLNWLNTHIKL